MTLDLLNASAPKSAPKPILVPFAKAAGLKPLPARDVEAATMGQLARSTTGLATGLTNGPTISQMVVQWQGKPLDIQLLPSRYSADYLVAMHDLVKRIAQIQTSHQTSQQSDSSAQILPYVSEAANDLVRKQADWRAAIPVNQADLELQSADWKTLASWLLWRMVQSTHETLQLIEGNWAQVATAGQWQSGILRLVVLLELEESKSAGKPSRQAFDLVMAEPAPTLLPASRLLQIKSLLGQQPMSVAAYLQQVIRQSVMAAPMLREFFEGYAASWLIPHQDWQTGTLKLRLGLAFSPGTGNSRFQPQLQPQPQPQPVVTFSQPSWLEQHVSVAVTQQLTQILLQLPPTADTPETIVKRAQTAIHDLQNSLTLASRTFGQQAVTLEELAVRLLWGINRTAYEVMQLTSGLSVRLLQPDRDWTSGLLRLGLSLELRTPQRHWQFDLARRVNLAERPRAAQPLAPTALTQAHDHLWCLQPIQLSSLEARFWQQIEQVAPELALLRVSTEVTIAAGELQGELGVVQLKAGFELNPNKPK